ncbi:MAG: hypothetical protein R2706_05070 [Acidimicrobiales bacterium]
MSAAPFEVAADAVECARIRHEADVDPLVAESLLMLRRRLDGWRRSPSSGHRAPMIISLAGD